MTPFLIFLGIAVFFVAVVVALNENEEKNCTTEMEIMSQCNSLKNKLNFMHAKYNFYFLFEVKYNLFLTLIYMINVN